MRANNDLLLFSHNRRVLFANPISGNIDPINFYCQEDVATKTLKQFLLVEVNRLSLQEDVATKTLKQFLLVDL
jgi:hypothetical protein